jgi:hypothetical protein
MATNNNSGTPFSSVSAYNSNISIMASRFGKDGSLIITDANPVSAYISTMEVFLSSGNLYFKYFNTMNTTMSGGVIVTSLSAASLT